MKLLRPSAIYHSLTRVMFQVLVQKGYAEDGSLFVAQPSKTTSRVQETEEVQPCTQLFSDTITQMENEALSGLLRRPV